MRIRFTIKVRKVAFLPHSQFSSDTNATRTRAWTSDLHWWLPGYHIFNFSFIRTKWKVEKFSIFFFFIFYKRVFLLRQLWIICYGFLLCFSYFIKESFFYVNYGSSIITSKVSQMISVMKTLLFLLSSRQKMKIHNWHSIKTLLTYVTHVFTKKITNSQSSNIFQQIIIHKPYMPKIILKTINFFFPILNHTKTATRQWKDSLNINNILKEA